MQTQFPRESQKHHLDAVLRGVAFAACLGLTLLSAWSLTLAANGAFLAGIHTVSRRAVGIANAPAPTSRPWRLSSLTNLTVTE